MTVTTSPRLLPAIVAASVFLCQEAVAGATERDRMPAKPEFGAPSTDAMPRVVMNADAGRQASGLPPSRLSRSMRAAFAADDAPTRGKAEEKLFATFARSVVLVVLPEGLGSGAVIGKDGTIVTNNHVAGGFKSVGVIFKPRRAGAEPRIAEAVEAKVLYVDEVADLAIIKVAALPPDVKPFALGDLRKLAVGADVHAIGHPVGESWSYTKGVVSQIRPDYEWRYETGPQHRADVVQTQTPINPGNSGGPLLNSAGEIVGLNTFGGGRAQGINFAVAVTEIKRFVALRKDRRAPIPRPPSTRRCPQRRCPPPSAARPLAKSSGWNRAAPRATTPPATCSTPTATARSTRS